MAQLGRQAGALRTDSAKGLEAYRDRLRAGAKALDDEVIPAGTYNIRGWSVPAKLAKFVGKICKILKRILRWIVGGDVDENGCFTYVQRILRWTVGGDS